MNSSKYAKEVEILKVAFSQKEYEKVILLAPQLLVKIIDELAELDYELWRYDMEKFESEIPKSTQDAYKIINNLSKKSSDKLYIAEGILTSEENGLLNNGKGNSFAAYYTRLEQLINTRNHIAHEYYSRRLTESKLRIACKAGISLLELFINHEHFVTNA